MNKKELSKINTNQFGIPSKKKYPMQDLKHLKSAIAYFHKADPKDRKELAKNIIKRYNELGADFKVGEANPLYSFLPDKMKKKIAIKESSVITRDMLSILEDSLYLESDKVLIEMLINKDLNTLDDLDDAIPDEYPNKPQILGMMKSLYSYNEYIEENIELKECSVDQFIRNVKVICEAEYYNYGKVVDLGIEDGDFDVINTLLDNLDNTVDGNEVDMRISSSEDGNVIGITSISGKDGTMYSSLLKGVTDDYESYK